MLAGLRQHKKYLTNPSILATLVPRKIFLIYVRSMDHALEPLFVQHNEQGQEQTIYYLSLTLIGTKHKYNPIEKEFLALVFVIQKIGHYITGQIIHVVLQVNT